VGEGGAGWGWAGGGWRGRARGRGEEREGTGRRGVRARVGLLNLALVILVYYMERERYLGTILYMERERETPFFCEFRKTLEEEERILGSCFLSLSHSRF
jgi:hypothetical protein